MNKGILQEELKLAFPDVVPVFRPLFENPKILDPNWLAVFTSAEECFYVLITKSTTKIGFQVQLVFQLTQYIRDEKLMRSLIKLFGCGNIYKRGNAFDFCVIKFGDITQNIIPFFKNPPPV